METIRANWVLQDLRAKPMPTLGVSHERAAQGMVKRLKFPELFMRGFNTSATLPRVDLGEIETYLHAKHGSELRGYRDQIRQHKVCDEFVVRIGKVLLDYFVSQRITEPCIELFLQAGLNVSRYTENTKPPWKFITSAELLDFSTAVMVFSSKAQMPAICIPPNLPTKLAQPNGKNFGSAMGNVCVRKRENRGGSVVQETFAAIKEGIIQGKKSIIFQGIEISDQAARSFFWSMQEAFDKVFDQNY
ncbi:hypothetical protein B0J14DRAFT_707402 [Halenospora varia]|nr:hypothetical protein B0J14DRAFT_707402 [Halenospora varia]